MLRLYQSLVTPKLEYCIQAWRPYLKKDIDLLILTDSGSKGLMPIAGYVTEELKDLLEKVQRRATRLMTSDKSLSYTDRLQKFGLTTL